MKRFLARIADLLRPQGEAPALAAPPPEASAVLTPEDAKDLFRGYMPGDEQRVARLMAQGLTPDPAAFTDAFGVKVDPSYCPWVGAGQVETRLPFPRSYLGDGIEFAAIALALEMAAGRERFSAAELGAGWGPWTSMLALCAERLGFRDIHLAAFEADPERYQVMRKHLALNGVAEGRFSRVATFCAAAWWRDETMYWPVDAGVHDAGLVAVSGDRPTRDYRGKEFAFQEIPARSIATALADFAPIDFLHIDIQGSEWDLVSNTLDYLNANVRTMFIGTHSRKIEGDLLDLLRTNRWLLQRERPCQFYSMSPAPTLTGQTYHDGGQFWTNQALGA